MARPLRTDFLGALHHVTSRGNEQRDIFRDDQDRLTFLRLLGEAATRFGWSVTAYVLMTNHFHLVVQTRAAANLSKGMHWFNTSYAVAFNRRHKRVGHLYGGRFKGILVETEVYLSKLLRYVVLNPVRAKMVARPEDYVWSSYRATAGLTNAPDWLDVNSALLAFAPDLEAARLYYQAFVAESLDSEESLWDELINAIYLGTEAWAKRTRAFVESKPRSTDHPRTQRAVGRPSIQNVIAAVASAASESASRIRQMRGGGLRRIVAWLGWHEGWVTLRSIAAAMRLSSEGHVSGMIRRLEAELDEDPALLRTLDLAMGILRTA